MAFGQGRVSEGAMNQHKSMAGAGDKGNFGVGKLPQRASGVHPDLTIPKGQTMDDGARGAKPAIEGKGRRMQASPDHGPRSDGHFRYPGA